MRSPQFAIPPHLGVASRVCSEVSSKIILRDSRPLPALAHRLLGRSGCPLAHHRSTDKHAPSLHLSMVSHNSYHSLTFSPEPQSFVAQRQPSRRTVTARLCNFPSFKRRSSHPPTPGGAAFPRQNPRVRQYGFVIDTNYASLNFVLL